MVLVFILHIDCIAGRALGAPVAAELVGRFEAYGAPGAVRTDKQEDVEEEERVLERFGRDELWSHPRALLSCGMLAGVVPWPLLRVVLVAATFLAGYYAQHCRLDSEGSLVPAKAAVY
eukprot:TRINITY_DN3384_c0_g1_i1.p2 TRINITY_DN3384_c0_g1~~TRINITY_DN3384_c0_g1_i1.p2  ORF type:complete len:118 (-),score=36.28 TRINITY_DN3384_c0_g1_i1:108-461(-)